MTMVEYAVAFSQLVNRLKIAPEILGKIISAAQTSATAWNRANDSALPEYLRKQNQRKSEKLNREVEATAKAAGFTVMWPGLYPILVDNNGYQHHLTFTGNKSDE